MPAPVPGRARIRDLVYSLYERRLHRQLHGVPKPRHVGIILDGNRRWARAAGAESVNEGHRAGADKIEEFLLWCADAGVEIVTLWLLSTDNLARDDEELQPLIRIIEGTAKSLAANDRPWRVHPVGSLDLLPNQLARVLKEAADQTEDRDGLLVNVAVGYGGRREINHAIRSLLKEHSGRGPTKQGLAHA